MAATLTSSGQGRFLRGTFYYTSFADFIYQAATGEEKDGFDVRRYAQADATFAGFEVEGRVTVAEWGAGTLDLGAFFDMVSPKIDVPGNDNLPLIPPDRVGVSLEFTGWPPVGQHGLRAGFRTERHRGLRAPVGLLRRLARGASPGVFARATRRSTCSLPGTISPNDEQRLHTSVVKDLAPQPGRTIKAGLRMRF